MSGDWKQPYWEPGTEVHVHDIHGNSLGIGELLTLYDADSDTNEMPRIKLADGRVIEGCECWWIPVAEAEDAEREAKNDRRQ